jgi:hypothetical protein
VSFAVGSINAIVAVVAGSSFLHASKTLNPMSKVTINFIFIVF